jgi:dihydroneopterin aldolase
MSDTIFLKGLGLHAYHGVMQHEAKVGQTFYVDLKLDLELGTASRTDKLKDTVSYDFVVKTVAEAFCGRRYRLVEAAAGAVADAVLGASRKYVAFALPCTNLTRRSRRHSRMSA